MIYQHIQFETRGAISKLTLDRPSVMNALNRAAVEEIDDALNRVRDEGASRVLLLTGAGRAFCSGADIEAELAPPSGESDLGGLLDRHFNPLIEKMLSLPVPVVAAVNGAAAGAGCSLALAADLVLASRTAYFLLAFVNIGLVPDSGITWLLPRLVGRSRALQMMLMGERVDAAQAEQWGLIYKTVEPDELESASMTLAQRLANGPTQAYSLVRGCMRASMESTLAEVLALESRNQVLASRTGDFAEGVMAFRQKRPPRFGGR